MLNITSFKLLITSAFIAWNAFSCFAMDSVKEEKNSPPSVQSVVEQHWINGEFTGTKLGVIQNLLNSLYSKKNFERLAGQIHLLKEFGDQIDQSKTLISLFGAMICHSPNADKNLYEIAHKITQNIAPILTSVKEWARKELDSEYQQIDPSSFLYLIRDCYLGFMCHLLQMILSDELVSKDYYQLGILLSNKSTSYKESSTYIEKFLVLTSELPTNDEKIIASFTLNIIQNQASTVDHVKNINMPPHELVDWVKNNYNTLSKKFKPESHSSIYSYIYDNYKNLFSMEHYILKDFLFCKINEQKCDYLSFIFYKEKPFIPSTHKMFPFDKQKTFYEKFSEEALHKAETRNLGLFALLCWRQLLNFEKKNDFDVSLRILETHMKYFTQKDSSSDYIEKQREDLFNATYTAYQKSSKIDLDSYRLAKIAYKIFKRKEKLNEWKENKVKKEESTKQGRLLENLFFNSLTKTSSRSLLAKNCYYISLIKGILNDIKSSKEYLDKAYYLWEENTLTEKQITAFWILQQMVSKQVVPKIVFKNILFYCYQNENHFQKIKEARLQIARSAFSEGAYSEVLRQYDEINNAQGSLDNDALVIKLLSLNKLGYQEATNQLMTHLLDKYEGYPPGLFDEAKQRNDNESIILLYKLMKHHRHYQDHKIETYLSAQFALHNHEEVCHESELYFSNAQNEIDKLAVLPSLILSCAQLNQVDKFSLYLTNYVDCCNIMNRNSSIINNKEIVLKNKLIKFHNKNIILHTMSNNIQKDFILAIFERLNATNLPLSCDTSIYMANIFSWDNKHQEAYDSLSKALCFTKNNISFLVNESTSIGDALSEDYKDGHSALKMAYPRILTSLMQLGKEQELNCFTNYLNKHHQINLTIKKQTQKRRNNQKAITTAENLKQSLVKLFLNETDKSYQDALVLQKSLETIKPHEWQKFQDTNTEAFLEKASHILNICKENRKTLQIVDQKSSMSPSDMEAAHKAHDQFNSCIRQFNQMLAKPLSAITLSRKQEARRKALEDAYQIDENNFLANNTTGQQENYKASLKLREIQNQQKQVLIKEKQKLREGKRRVLQETYEANFSEQDAVNSEFPEDTLLIKSNTLPFEPDDYSPEHCVLLHQILSKKFNLDNRDQETLRIILTKGERVFQITLSNIKRLFLKFEGFTDDMHHGGNHEKISGMGITFMPNANGIKEGSYWGQVKQAKEKIIYIIAKTLMIKDL